MDPNNNFSEILSSLMSNPKVTELISDISAKAQTSAEPKPSNTSPNEQAEAKDSDNGTITIPPEILANLPQMMSALSGLGIGSGSSSEDKGTPAKKETSRDNQRKALLCALKPYLSEKRCAVIDGLLQFESFSHILSVLNNSN